MLTIALLALVAVLLDGWLGEPRRWHPLIGFGKLADRVENKLNDNIHLTPLARHALTCWKQQAPHWDSPNAGPVMAAGAGALEISIGGPARYGGEWHQRPRLGIGKAPTVEDIERSLQLVRHGLILWLGTLLFIGVIMTILGTTSLMQISQSLPIIATPQGFSIHA